MSEQHEFKEQRIGLWLVGGVAGLTVLTTLFLSVWDWENSQVAGSPGYGAAVSADTVVVQLSAALSSGTAAVERVDGMVKFYFATGKADLAAGAAEALQDMLAGVKAGKTVVVSGYHSNSGSVAFNRELSKQRAFAVRDALLALGVPDTQIELRKPAETDAGDGMQAQRVEVLLAD